MTPSNPVRQQIHEDGYAIITLDRPERRNALNLEIKQLLAQAVETLAADSRVHALVITGAGGVFCCRDRYRRDARHDPDSTH
jgi:enoyl-CoA hydratase